MKEYMRQRRVTYILAVVIILVFVADLLTSPGRFTAEYLIYGNFGTESGVLTRYGMLVNIREMRFQLWRLVTTIFLHAGIPHLLVNLAALLLAGTALERSVGSIKFRVLFFLTGIVASLVNMFFTQCSVGASGAIYGVIGCLFCSGNFRRKEKWAPVKLIMLLLYLILPNLSASTAIVAHAAGFAAGAVSGFILRRGHNSKRH